MRFSTFLIFHLLVIGLWSGTIARAASAADLPSAAGEALADSSQVLEVAGSVEYRAVAGQAWQPARAGIFLRPGDRVRTGEGSRAAVRLSDRSVLRLGERTTLELQPARSGGKRRFGLLEGILFFFNRERPADVEFETPIATGAIRGTEFVLEAEGASGPTRLALLDGRVELEAAGATVTLGSGEQARVQPGQAPVAVPLMAAATLLQWALYYPAVAVPEDLSFEAADREPLAESLAAYRAGDLLAAHAAVERVPAGSAGRETYRAALDLAVGRVDRAEARLAQSGAEGPVARALRALIVVVRGGAGPADVADPATASEWLARSYVLQARFRLREAADAAHRAAGLAPASGLAHARVAELEVTLEHRAAARAALDRALALAPRLAVAWSIRGFLRLENGDPRGALEAFDEALAVDAALGSAWLGRGLVQMRLREREEALRSLQAAVALEPRRALHRSYLAKGFGEAGEEALAAKEFRLAKELDPADPTAWLYSALAAWMQNLPNRAVRDLERSVELNDHRQLFRSRLGLDRDLAVRQADQAAVYRDAGLPEVGRQAAARAVGDDYTQFAGHLFLANSYQQLEDRGRHDLRYETARQSELLVANLLAPPGGANLSQLVSQQEHLRFFDARPFGGSSYTEYRSDADWRQETSVFGSLDGFAYAVDSALVWQDGPGVNDERERRDVSVQLKQRIAERDELYFQAAFAGSEAGDVARHYDPGSANPGLAVEERQVPDLYLGWHRAWSPASHTLVLVSWLNDDLALTDPEPGVLFLRQADGAITGVSTPPLFDLDYRSRFSLASAELQHLWQTDHQTLVAGVRGQWGEITPEATLSRPLSGVVTDQKFNEPIRRFNGYVYEHWRVADPLRLVAGLSYDRLTHPVNSEIAPLTEGGDTRDQVSPKAGLILTPWRDGVLRAAYSRSLGGVYFDDSVRLEPAQLAGFNQAFRSLLPESVAGLVPGTRFGAASVALDQRLGKGTYLGVEAEELRSEGDRVVGVLTNSLPLPVPDSPSATRQELDFRERSLGFYAVQLIGDGLALGARYRIAEAALDGSFPGIPPGVPGRDRLAQDETSQLQTVALTLNYQHSSGLFGGWESDWFRQANRGYTPERPGDDFWQHQVQVGYRWPRRRAELRLGILNLTGSDYRLNPLNLYPALPRERTFVASLRLNF